LIGLYKFAAIIKLAIIIYYKMNDQKLLPLSDADIAKAPKFNPFAMKMGAFKLNDPERLQAKAYRAKLAL
jgi:hypothetical protein